ncbi:MAG TPA: cell division topological specificity factor MinE [Chloroflexi bacterium]|nr:cell division topological specificity factor MinE [Chloroflexota bacterium]
MFRRKQKSASSAKDRLQFVLIHDRTNLTPEQMNRLKDELLAVLAKYVSIDGQGVNISVEQDGREQRLLADIPLKPAETLRRR